MLLGLTLILASLSSQYRVTASITVYSQEPFGVGTTTAAAATYTGAAAYDPTVLNPPPVPSPPPPTQFSIQLQSSSSDVNGLSIPQSGSFLGFSIEFSVINQVLGINSSFLQVPFLNLMGNLKERAGRVNIRVGGNTQDSATLVASLPDGKMIEKDTSSSQGTPALVYTPEVLYMMSNISALVNVGWYLGIPLNDSSNLRLGIAEVGETVLGDRVLGFQVGNEPDLYVDHGHRSEGYGPFDYAGEFGEVVIALQNDTNVQVVNDKLIGPNIATGDWTPEMVWDTGFIPSYSSSLAALAVEHYPSDNCAVTLGIGTFVDPQTIFPTYLDHNAGKNIIQPYLNSSTIALAAGKPFLMMETNTASCGGFPGVSDSFGSALWALDYGLQMAYSNFSGAMLHVGGQSDYYNPFTPPPTNQSTFHQWTIGPVYYASLIIAEAFGASNESQIIDLNANSANIYTPAYAIYDSGNLVRLALFNFVTDPSGASDNTATISVGGGQTGEPNGVPAQVQVKYLVAPSVSEKSNITWAGQTFGGDFASDGRLQGALDIRTITCDQTANTCQIPVPAPGFAMVFLSSSDPAVSSSPDEALTFSTTAVTKTMNTATVNPSVLATSNGHSGKDLKKLGSTSQGSVSANGGRGIRGYLPGFIALSIAVGVSVVVGRVGL